MNLTPPLENTIKLIDRWLSYKVYADRIPGLSIGIVHQGNVLFTRGYGYANIEQKIPASDTTTYRIASISKIFTTLTIMQLFEQGKIQLDERVQTYLPWCTSEKQPEIGQITIRQLLTHTSGINRDGDTPHWNDYHFPAIEHIQQHVAEGAMTYTPAEYWKYSNMGFTLLGAVIQAVTGVSYEAYVTQAIVKPLGMQHTAPTVTAEVAAQLASGYSLDLPDQERTPFPTIETYAMASATGFSSNAMDLCQFMLAQLNGDTRLLKEETKREMRRIQWIREGFSSDWCIGYETWTMNNRRYYGHGGSFQGYRSRFALDVDRDLGVAILTNAMDGAATTLTDGALQMIDTVINSFDEYATLEEMPKAPEPLERYAGCYRSVWGDVEIAPLNESLVSYNPRAASPSKDFHLLRYKQKDQFTVINGDSFGMIGETVRFEFDAEGIATRVWVGPDYSDRVKL